MQATFTQHLHQPFELSEDSIRSLYNALSVGKSIPSISSNCDDDTERRFASINELFAYENPDHRKINSLEISSVVDKYEVDKYEVDTPHRFRIDFKSIKDPDIFRNFGRSIIIILEMPDRNLTSMKEKILDIIYGTNLSYAYLYKIKSHHITFGIWLILALLLMWAGYVVGFVQDSDGNSDIIRILNCQVLAYIITIPSSKITTRLFRHFFHSMCSC